MKRLMGRIILEYLRFFAKWKLRRIHPRIIGVTGSVGKTSTIHGLHLILSKRFRTKTTWKGNSESGIPLEILNIKLADFSPISWLKAMLAAPVRVFDKDAYDVLIVEMGVDAPTEPKNMGYLLRIVKPDIGVLLNVSAVHTEQFGGDVEAIAREKSRLVSGMDASGTAVINTDDRFLGTLPATIAAHTLTFGKNKSATLRITGHSIKGYSTTFSYEYQGKPLKLVMKNRLFMEEYGYLFAAMLLAGVSPGMDVEESARVLEKEYTLPPGRLSVIPGLKGSVILDSSYNASPVATTAVLQLVKGLPVRGRKILVLGDMRELGPLAQRKHGEIGIAAAQVGDVIVLVGPNMEAYARPAILHTGFPSKHVVVFDTAEGVGKYIREKVLKKDDLVVVKGSQNTIFLETVVYDLMKDKTQSASLLCRQGPYWERVRQGFFSKHL